ncbi:MAG: VCBS repeat-containing protein [Planctomycetes bacterium]|nr:VCBS repeat-containing protein [Planctomycetota bacterium]
MKSRVFAVVCGAACSLLLSALTVDAQTIFNPSPNWVSGDAGYATGAALVDLNRDGWLDLVVSNGNDMNRERLSVYYNTGSGAFPSLSSWQSSDIAYNGHLDVADVNGDGWPDVAVALLLNQGGPCAKLYMNNAGTLSSTPAWVSSFVAPAFTVAFGDMNNDGRPDLAVGTGDAYGSTPHAYRNVVHMNVGGALETTPSWQSADTWCYDSLMWVDATNDGWLDLIGLGSLTYTWGYANAGGALNTATAWRTNDVPSQFGLMACAGDLNGDGYPELIIADNNQLGGGSGRFRRYNGQAAGFFSQTANWTYSDGYCSAVELADVDGDGDLDLATGAWWDRTRIFLNTAGNFGAAPNFTSGGTSVVEKIVFGDIRNRTLRTRVETFPASSRRLYYLAKQPIQWVSSVRLDGVPLGPSQYYANIEHGWITVHAAPAVSLEVEYTYSIHPDMAISNWDPSIGNYVYFSRLPCNGDVDGDGDVDLSDLTVLLAHFGQTSGATWAGGDQDGDGDVDLSDLTYLLAGFGSICS